MITFKQLEAVFWVVRSGGFAQAANKLHTTQSAVSKRIQELEQQFNTPLFDRTLRAARMTEKGEEMFLLARRLLEHRDEALEQFLRPEVLERHFRIGVTELSAMTWLPKLIGGIQTAYPRVIIEPHVDASAVLRDKLLADEIDLMIVPDMFNDQRFSSEPIATVKHAWMSKPGMVERRDMHHMHDLARMRLLIQDNNSGTGLLYNRWLQSIGIHVENYITCSSLVALIGLTVSGMGISYLPADSLKNMVSAGQLEMLDVNPDLPVATYVAVFKTDRKSVLMSSVMILAKQHVDFGSLFQTGE
jgi:DNA-binding transcriptional LysR family regulator